MIALVTGGASSGKSAYAERLACALPAPRAYVATMRRRDDVGGVDAEVEARIARHRKQREGLGFETIELAETPMANGKGRGAPSRGERTSALEDDGVPAAENVGAPEMENSGALALQGENPLRTVLVEDLGNAVANGLEEALEPFFACENVIVVGNEVGCDGARYDDFTRAYLERIGTLSQDIAARADVVVEVVCGVPNVVKDSAGALDGLGALDGSGAFDGPDDSGAPKASDKHGALDGPGTFDGPGASVKHGALAVERHGRPTAPGKQKADFKERS